MHIEGELRVWWIPQVPGTPFHVPVRDVDEAKLVLLTLEAYDAFQFKQKIKPDYCNAGGLEIYVSGEWEDWADERGRSIEEVLHIT